MRIDLVIFHQHVDVTKLLCSQKISRGSDSYKQKELTQIAKLLKIDGYSTLTKDQLVAHLIKVYIEIEDSYFDG